MNDCLLKIEGIDCDGHQDGRYNLFKEHIQHTVNTATSLHKKLPEGALFDVQDLTMIGLKALWDSTEGYDQTINPNFWGYAKPRVHGSMIDELRSIDHLSRSNRDMLKKIDEQRQVLEQKLGCNVAFGEACTSLGIDGDRESELYEVSSISFLSLDSIQTNGHSEKSESGMTLADVIADSHEPDSVSTSDRDKEIVELEKLLQRLEPIERSVIRLYFFSGLHLHDIGTSIGLTESRIRQILAKSLDKLRKLMFSKEDLFGR